MSNKPKYTTAKGKVGTLIASGGTFRLHDGEGGIKDYDILNCDLKIQIVDLDAELVEFERDSKKYLYLDWSRRTLGLDKEGNIEK